MNVQIFQQTFLENTLFEYAVCFAILLAGFLFSGLIAKVLSWFSYRIFKRISKEKYRAEFSTLLHKPFLNLILLAIVYVALSRLHFPEAWHIGPNSEFGLRWFIKVTFKITFIVFVTRLLLRLTDFVEYVYQQDEDSASKDLARFLKNLTKILINIFAFFIILAEVFEVNITAVVASLGIGGLAVALAAQDTLANLIGSFIIYLDKPFQVGDLIEITDIRGRVEQIGFRTTKIRTLDKSLVTVPNKKVIDSNLNNITLSEQRRVSFTIGLTYSSKSDAILKIVEDIKEAIKSYSPQTADEFTVRFIDFDASSLNILIIYFVNSNEFDLMVEIKEKVNIDIMHIVEKHGCQFAFPTQTIHLQK